jgi:hypothetical protein
MFARRIFRDNAWSVVVTKDRSPLSPIVENVPCGSKGDAWTTLQRIKTELKAEHGNR